MVSLAFWAFGVLATLSGVFCLAMLAIVPTFSLQNDMWNRADNPYTLLNGIYSLAIGSIAIYAARGSDRRRVAVVVFAIVVSVVEGLYYLGVFAT